MSRPQFITAGLSAAEAVGLSAAKAALRLAAEGPNLPPQAQTRNIAAIALGVLREPMFTLLVAADLFRFAPLGAASIDLSQSTDFGPG